jgi:CheY-like chemotaxis protein
MQFDQQTILVVEDNEDDVYILNGVFRKAAIANPIQLASDGQQASDYIAGVGQFANREQFPLPFLVLLDLKLPYRHGFEVLQSLRSQSTLDHVSVVVLTSSAEERDIVKAYDLGARSFLVKPPTVPMVQEMMTVLRQRLENGDYAGILPISCAKRLPGVRLPVAAAV